MQQPIWDPQNGNHSPNVTLHFKSIISLSLLPRVSNRWFFFYNSRKSPESSWKMATVSPCIPHSQTTCGSLLQELQVLSPLSLSFSQFNFIFYLWLIFFRPRSFFISKLTCPLLALASFRITLWSTFIESVDEMDVVFCFKLALIKQDVFLFF